MEQEDHDLLIEINTQVSLMREEIKTLKTSDETHVRMREFLDHENRIRRLERWGFLAAGALFVIEFVLNYWKR